LYNNTTQPTAVIFLRARHLGTDGSDREVAQRMIAAQRTACEQRAEALGAQIIREYVEVGGTGGIDKRPALRLMLDELRALHDADYVVVTSPDRLARKTDDMVAIFLEIEAGGAQLVTAASLLGAEYLAPGQGRKITVKAGK
jgi:site-specific DNA recombinase